ncbi:hypothetical protein TcCL_NonESM12049 [Trypanosoma cruzi]|uniref:Uncharacterized protein n=1 Tax=Trypanosoma cruzi (strain CL Brener) TaxID=353153 RepID=Q4DQ72_TRYCC|nr:hypothetical protein Tc00.1047053507085.130 [Trypanosoma cruzi]EAN94676.1 hypothetical protein Tc00.1047053507085.130 [Trypanosoma cruzi]RNC38681.1 hypothetical protein TcCL_NonESM12049 [Trypanosoma cruzi]|eukprot:XP_816527.1 hypothetical protein [Trypanosoma cruzi strain CL Brener]
MTPANRQGDDSADTPTARKKDLKATERTASSDALNTRESDSSPQLFQPYSLTPIRAGRGSLTLGAAPGELNPPPPQTTNRMIRSHNFRAHPTARAPRQTTVRGSQLYQQHH